MSSTIGSVKPNPYLFNIENKKRKPRLAHEAGAGANCNNCGDKCPGFELHFWRKLCLNCRCSKDDHAIEDDDDNIGVIAIGKLFERPIRTKAEEAEYCHGTDLEILNDATGKPEKLTFEWVPPDINKKLASRYMMQLPVDKRPVAGSEAAKKRKKQLEQQLPIYDVDETMRSDGLVPEELQKYQAYMEMIRSEVAGQGFVQELVSLLPPTYAKPLQGGTFPSVAVSVPSSGYTDTNKTPKDASFMPNVGPMSNSQSGYPHSAPHQWQANPNLTSNSTETTKCDPYTLPHYAPSTQAGDLNQRVMGHNQPYLNQEPAISYRDDNTGHLNSAYPGSKVPYSNEATNIPHSGEAANRNVPYYGEAANRNVPYSGGPISGEATNRNVPYPGEAVNRNVPYSGEATNRNVPHSEGVTNRNAFLGSLLGSHTPTDSNQSMDQERNNNLAAKTGDLASLSGAMDLLNLHPSQTGYTASENAQLPGNDPHLPYGDGYNTDSTAHQQQYPGHEAYNANQNNKNIPPHSEITTSGNHAVLLSDPMYPDMYVSSSERVGQRFPPSSNQFLPRGEQEEVHARPVQGGDFKPGTELGSSGSEGYNTPMGLVQMIPYGKNVSTAEAMQAPYAAQVDRLTGQPLIAGSSDVHIQFPSETAVLGGRGQVNAVDEQHVKNDFYCQSCEQTMLPGDVAIICERAGPGKYWHPACFVCVTCKELLADLIYFFKDDKIYCGRHFASVVDIPRCNACDELIFGNSWTRADGYDWHLQHYSCFACDKELAGNKYVPDKKGHSYCLDCYMAYLAQMCETCENKIGPTEKQVSFRGYFYHGNEKCFSCHTCRVPLKSFKMSKNWLFCTMDCFNAAAEDLRTNPNPKEKSTTQLPQH